MKPNNYFMTHTLIHVTFTYLVLSYVNRPIDINGIDKTLFHNVHKQMQHKYKKC